MHRFVQGDDRAQASFLPASLEDYIDADNPARVIDAFVEALDLGALALRLCQQRRDGRAIIRQFC